MKKISIVFGTRPELIKMAPVIKAFKEYRYIDIDVCFTGQHKEMVTPLLEFFGIEVNHSLQIMEPNQSLARLNSKALESLNEYLEAVKPDLILVQGDTTTAMSAAVTAFYKKIPIGHIEAGLRTGNIYSPFPEEYNRRVISVISNFHFAPTDRAKDNLIREGFDQNSILVTGNTVIDSLSFAMKYIQSPEFKPLNDIEFLHGKRVVLITGHRRENFGEPLKNICDAIGELAQMHPEFDFAYPVHLNPNVQKSVFASLTNIRNVHLLPPLDYINFIWLMNVSFILLSDSGGIQEEAAYMSRPVIVMRENTEREEAIDAGTAILSGTNKDSIKTIVHDIITNKDRYQQMAAASNPFGDGKAGQRITDHIANQIL